MLPFRIKSCLFQIFVLVVFFGLYNGLVVLPILLSFCGPSFKPSEDEEQVSDSQLDQEDANRHSNERDAVSDDELKQLSPTKKASGIKVTTC